MWSEYLHKPLDNVLYLFIDTSAPGKLSETINSIQSSYHWGQQKLIYYYESPRGCVNRTYNIPYKCSKYQVNRLSLEKCTVACFLFVYSFSYGVLWVLINYSYTLMGVLLQYIRLFWLHPLPSSIRDRVSLCQLYFVYTTRGSYWFLGSFLHTSLTSKPTFEDETISLG